jgi:hypothetical protein
VSVRVRLGARLGPRDELRVVSGFSQVGQSVFLVDDTSTPHSLVRLGPDGLGPLRILSGVRITWDGSDDRAKRSVPVDRAQEIELHSCPWNPKDR